jgi:hypothetical protein
MKAQGTALAVAIALAWLAACSADPSVGNDLQTFSATQAEGKCNACVVPPCAAVLALCSTSTPCRVISDCMVGAGGDMSRAAACYDATPLGRAAYDHVERCVDVALCTSCSTACPAPADSDASVACPLAASSTTASCPSCAAAHCASEALACANGTACASYLLCVESTRSTNLFEACERDDESGFSAARALAACVHTSCTAECE